MPQLRQDRTTKEWVIIATERSKRPQELKRAEPLVEKPSYKENCPFCPGNEYLTPHETLAYRKSGPADGKGWWVRVVPNKFPALSPAGFEMGSGIYINVSFPEETAQFLREG